jgi:CelD/BcsL family acetyltransferase involved in cellulose biosynthesis
MSREIEWIDSKGRFEALAGEWDAILPGEPTPFDLHCWHLAWLGAFAGGRQLAVCTVREEGALTGALPLLRVGGRLEAMSNVHSNLFRPLAAGPEAMDALIAAALEGTRGITLAELPDEDPAVGRLAAGARDAGMMVLTEPGTASPIVATDGDPDAWAAGANSNWIKRVRRYRRKLKKDHEATFVLLESPADLEAELAAAFALEASGWKGSAGTAIVSQPQTEAFYRGVATAFHAREELILNRIMLDGELAAFNICIDYGGRLYALKTAYNESFRKIAPGLVLQVTLVEACFERGLDAYEILGETAEWKRNLATSHRTHSTLRGYRRNPVGFARYGYRRAARPRLRSVYRRLRRLGSGPSR